MRFQAHQHELFVEVKYLPAGCRETFRFDHESKVPAALADAARLALHIQRKHRHVGAVLVVDDDGLFEELLDQDVWPSEVRLLLAGPSELARRGLAAASA